MSAVRAVLRLVAAIWLACQLAAVAAAPLSLCCADMPEAGQQKKCCPGLRPGQVCPMHHTRDGDRTCAMRSACGRLDIALVSLAGGLGVLPDFTASGVALQSLDRVAPAPATILARADLPESPPPRS